jgi:hypothetical protein
VGYFEFLIIIEHFRSIMESERNCSTANLGERGAGQDVRFRGAVYGAVEQSNGATGMAYRLLEPNNWFCDALVKTVRRETCSQLCI